MIDDPPPPSITRHRAVGAVMPAPPSESRDWGRVRHRGGEWDGRVPSPTPAFAHLCRTLRRAFPLREHIEPILSLVSFFFPPFLASAATRPEVRRVSRDPCRVAGILGGRLKTLARGQSDAGCQKSFLVNCGGGPKPPDL